MRKDRTSFQRIISLKVMRGDKVRALFIPGFARNGTTSFSASVLATPRRTVFVHRNG